MGEAVWIRGKFKTEKERHAEIQKELIEGLSQYLSPNCFSAEWEKYFESYGDCLELDFEAFGKYGMAQDYIAQKFIKEHSDVVIEFSITNYDECCTEKMLYDGENMTYQTICDEDCDECYDEDYDEEIYCECCQEVVNPDEGFQDEDGIWYCNEEEYRLYMTDVWKSSISSYYKYLKKDYDKEALAQKNFDELKELIEEIRKTGVYI